MGKLRFLILLVLLSAAGCGGQKAKYTPAELEQMGFVQKEGLPDVSGGFVLSVAGEPITADEVMGPVFERLAQLAARSDFERFRTLASPAIQQVLTARISNAVLYSKAKEEFGEDAQGQISQAAETEVRRFVVSFGGDYAKAEQSLKQMGLDWGSFEEFQKKRIMSQSYIAQQMPQEDMVTYSELVAMYDRIKDELYTTVGGCQFQLIDIQPAKLMVDAGKSRYEAARELAEEIINRHRGGEDFGELAKQYSHGHRASIGAGGLWQKLDPQSLVKPYDILAVEAARVRSGQIAGPIETDDHIFIMKVLEYKGKGVEPFEDVQNELKARIRFERQQKVIEELNAKLMEQAMAEDTSRFVDYCVREIYRMANR